MSDFSRDRETYDWHPASLSRATVRQAQRASILHHLRRLPDIEKTSRRLFPQPLDLFAKIRARSTERFISRLPGLPHIAAAVSGSGNGITGRGGAIVKVRLNASRHSHALMLDPATPCAPPAFCGRLRFEDPFSRNTLAIIPFYLVD